MTDMPASISPVEIAEVAARKVSTSDTQTINPIPDTRPSILFCCPGSILDVSSGAALSLSTILAALAARGFRAVALQATIFDSTHGGEHVRQAGEPQKDKEIWRTVVNGVEHLIVKTGSDRRQLMTCQEEETFVNLFRNELTHRRPDMVFLWGSLVLERTVMREARDAGIPVVFYLVNAGYRDKAAFKDVSVIVTDTEATAALYKERHGFDCKVVGKFIAEAEFKPNVPRRPDFITFINPSFEKGVSVFMPLAKLAARLCPEIKFLVVQSRGRWDQAMQVLQFQPTDFPNVKVIGHQTDMRPVYASTRAVLLPSLWHESGARVIAEAHLNGIPVLASNTGGSAEMIGDGGKLFELSEEVKEKKGEAIITEEALLPWIEEIQRLWHDADYYQMMCARVDARREQHNIWTSTDKFIQAVSPEVLRSKGMTPKPKNAVVQALQKKQARQTAPKKKKRA